MSRNPLAKSEKWPAPTSINNLHLKRVQQESNGATAGDSEWKFTDVTSDVPRFRKFVVRLFHPHCRPKNATDDAHC